MILMMLMLVSLTRLLLHELETCHSYRIALVLTHLKPGFTPSGTRSSLLHKLVQDSWVMCILVQIPFGISSKELRVHRGGDRRENLVWRSGRVQTDIFLLHLLLGLDQPNTVSTFGPSRRAGICLTCLRCGTMGRSIKKRVTEPGGDLKTERRQSLPEGALCLPWGEKIRESRVELGECQSLARCKGLQDRDTAEGSNEQMCGQASERMSRELGT